MKIFAKILMSSYLVFMYLGASLPSAYAQEKYSLKEMTPEVQSALDGRKERYGQLQDLKSQGVIGENNRGYVEVLKNVGTAQGIAQAENQDRKIVYQAIEEQNGLTNALATIENVFAEVQRNKAKSGEKIQDESGKWISKQ